MVQITLLLCAQIYLIRLLHFCSEFTDIYTTYIFAFRLVKTADSAGDISNRNLTGFNTDNGALSKVLCSTTSKGQFIQCNVLCCL